MVRMWENGHSFDELRAMNLEDFGAVLGYWHEDGRISTKTSRVQKRNRRLANKGKG